MTIASGATVGLSYVVETTRGVTPNTPTMKALRTTSRNINLRKNPIVSNELRSDRQTADLRHGFNQVEGTLGQELIVEAIDDLLELGLADTWAAAADTGVTTLDTVSATSKITRAAGSFVTDGFEVGDWVILSGSAAANNGAHLVTAVTALEITVASTLTDDTGGGDEQLTAGGGKLKLGNDTHKTMTIERRFVDISRYQVFRGCAINTIGFDLQPDAIATCNFGIVGMASDGMSGTSLGTPTAAVSNSPLSSLVGAVGYKGSLVSVVTGLNFNLSNGRTVRPVIGSAFSPDVFEGTATVEGTLTAMLEDSSAYFTDFFDENEVTISARMVDPAGNWLSIVLPRCKINSGDIDPPQEGPIEITASFRALVSADHATSLIIQRSNS